MNPKNDRKRVLITGSLGYIGSVLTGYLNQNGFDCVGYDPGFFKDCLFYDPTVANTLMRDARDLEEADLQGIDAVVHLAGISNDPIGALDAAKFFDPTRVYARKIAELCKRLGIKFIFASSCSVYGIGQAGLLDENGSTYPQSPYSLSKLQIEQDLQVLSDKDFSPIAFRIATVFGLSPRMRFDLVANMLAGMAFTTGKIILNSDGKPWRPNVHVLDVCKAFKFAIGSDHNDGKLLVVNVGDEQNNLQVIDIAKIVQAEFPECELKFLKQEPQLDKEGLIIDRKVKDGFDPRTYKVSFVKIRQVFPGFKCDWPMARGVKEMVEAFKARNLTAEQFKSRNYYRLQKMEDLHQNNLLSDDLRWTQLAGERQ